MNSIIKDQLQKCKCPNIPEFTDSTTDILIAKSNVPLDNPILVGNKYLIKFEDYIVHPYEGFTLHKDWNNNVAPSSIFMTVEVIKIMGKMIKIEGQNYDDDCKCNTSGSWSGWVPMKSIKLINIL